jgi:hypothetical protein
MISSPLSNYLLYGRQRQSGRGPPRASTLRSCPLAAAKPHPQRQSGTWLGWTSHGFAVLSLV